MKANKASNYNDLWRLFLIATLLGLLFSLSSCEQEDVIPNSTEKVKIFMSQSDGGLKSAATNNSGEEIQAGDTVFSMRDLNTLMWAVTEYGLPISGHWRIDFVKSDYDHLPDIRPVTPFTYYYGDQIANKFLDFGLYRVSFKKPGNNLPDVDDFYFFVRIAGNPGKVGDESANNFIFRLESKSVYDKKLQKPVNLIFAYFKFEAEQNMDPAQAYVNLTDYQKDGSELSEMVHLKKWPFSRDYYYLIIRPSETSWKKYRLLFIVSDTQGFSGFADSNNYASSWTNGKNGIIFAIQ